MCIRYLYLALTCKIRVVRRVYEIVRERMTHVVAEVVTLQRDGHIVFTHEVHEQGIERQATCSIQHKV